MIPSDYKKRTVPVVLIIAAIGVSWWWAKSESAGNSSPAAENPRVRHALRQRGRAVASDIPEASQSAAPSPHRAARLTDSPLKENENQPAPVRLPQIDVATALYTGLSDSDFSKMDAHEQAAVSELGAYALEATQMVDANHHPEGTSLADEKDQVSSETDEFLRLSLGQDRFNDLSFLAAANCRRPTPFQPKPQH